ncbi:hypothetical protein BpHYR1_032477, partial [Brachionus plicatilis]
MSDSDKSGSSFWSALDNFLRARPTSTQADKEPKQDKKAEATLKTVQDFDQDAPSDEIFKRLNSLKSSEPFENRLKSFEELIKLSELFQLNESSINNFLKVTSDLYKIDRTPAEIRIKAFNYLIQFYQKKSDKFDSFMLRNHLLCFIIINCKKSKCIFLNALNQISKPTSPEDGHNSILENLRPSSNTKLLSDDLKLRLTLFLLVTRNGNNCKNLDPDLMSECLVYFLENSELLIDKFGDLFIMFKNLMTNKYFQYTNEQILTMLSRTILNFSYLVTANFERPGRLNQEDIKSCVDLIENLIENITSSICINYVVLCLCELLDIVWQNGQPRTEVQLSRNEALDFSDLLISQIYGCMSKLFVSPIGSYAVFTFFSEIFPI